MTPMRARQLTLAFPRLLAHHDGLYPFWCGDDWFQLLFDLASQFVALEPPEVDLHVNQVQETFGCLRFYTSSVLSATSQQRIEEPEARSFTICEACGAPGTLQCRSGWLQTRCLHHTALDDVQRQAMVILPAIEPEAV
jgi:hypothetical protein